MAKQNLIEQFNCPNCGHTESFDIDGSEVTITLTKEGDTNPRDIYWDDNCKCRCCECGHEAYVSDFTEGA